jgi:ribosomal protein S18 acetylase RimI-like enzyme
VAPDGRPPTNPGDGPPSGQEHGPSRRPQTRPARVTAYQAGEIRIGHREAIADIVRATGVFSVLEIAVALELFDTTYGPPSGPADAAGEGSGYEFLGLFDTAGGLLGYACFGPTPGTDRGYDLYWIAIAPQAQGAGAGSFLIGEVERRLRERNARLVLAETSSRGTYEPTRAFYVARGYTESARVRAFYGPEDDRVLFTKRLQPAPRVRGSRGGETR